MNDVVLLQITSSLFWLIIFGGSLWVFHKEIRKLLQSLSSFKVAGSSFDFKDRRETIQSYILLAEILIDILTRTEKIDSIQQVLVSSQVEKLSAFALRYTEEVSQQTWNEEMLRNIAYLLLRFGRYSQAVALCNALLEGRPDHVDLLNQKALAMITSRLPEQVAKALTILSDLVARYPELHPVRFNYALARSLASDHDMAIKEMEMVIRSPFLLQRQELLQDPLFQKTREEQTESFNQLEKLVKSELEART